MNTNLGLIGKKLGNTQIFDEDGSVTRVTAIEVGPCTVLGKRTPERDGYSALIVGLGEKREKLVNKPEAGFFAKAGQKPCKTVKEFRVAAEQLEAFEVGQVIKPSQCFAEGSKVDVSGVSKGRGFTGVLKRWGFKGAGTDGHGTHEYKRHGGSIGANMTPGRVLAGLKMAGQYGNKRVTVLNLKVAKVLDDEGVVLVKGAVPGPRNGILTVRGAVKAKAAKNAAA
ncbi:MAG: 50S ribosomal protein L3 [Myxococcales bacterium]|nr:50S ribosomal protein L3 [Myxococcales bacterium]MDD9971215.1 50S ribosomal protein L3 [Myxococcales bacterium]